MEIEVLMPWESINKETHECLKPDYVPDMRRQGIGSIWNCDSCHKRWKLVQIYGPNGSHQIIWESVESVGPRARFS